MEFTREINHLLIAMLLAFFMVGLSASYWALTGDDTILQREDNPRAVEDEAAIRRGSIFDRNGTLLVESVLVDGFLERHYRIDSFYSATGYFSLRFGVGGAEAAYDDILRGDTLSQDFDAYFSQEILHRPQEGLDIRLTLDSDVQQEIVDVMGDKRGAVVVLNVPDGDVLALVSLPTYNPNALDDEWDDLIEAPGNPFFNRVLQGQYQPGGMLQTPLMTAAILTNQTFDVITADADAPITVADVTLTCAVEPPESDLTFTQAYAYACPRPFALLAQQINQTTLENILVNFRLSSPPSLTGFIIENPEEDPEFVSEVTSEADIVEESNLIADLLGQGDLTINPLRIATLVAAVINEGNAPQPHALDAIRSTRWQIGRTKIVSKPQLLS
ncbi:MAG: penicillin-binding transpeptidase domain-containing protein [Anaerolineae bacterium]|nr:penicillin-binding transpeptidase domain-containing protein [Anaerolineae bacterium]